MPGVPTSRGCNACREQKKKCVVSTTLCSRCFRLGIPCLGLGQQRYKFKDEGKRLADQNNRPDAALARFATRPKQAPSSTRFIHNPSNSLTRLTLALVDKIDPSIDISIQLVWNFGGFLQKIPRRLGANASLDAASDVLVTAYTRYCTGHIEPDGGLLVKHSRALSALGQCLNDPVTAHSSETLCSIMVLLICQTLMGKSVTPWMSHSVGAAQILKCRGYSGPKDDFEHALLLTLRGPVAVEALFDSRICITKREWTDLVVTGLDDGTAEGEVMGCLCYLPDLMRRGRDALKRPESSRSALLGVISELRSLHQAYQPILKTLREQQRSIDTSVVAGNPSTAGLRRMLHCHHSRMLAFGLAVGIVLDCVLGNLKIDDYGLRQDSAQMSHEIFELAGIVAAYRPLGALSMTLCLSAAWCGVADTETKARIEALIVDYLRDIHGPKAAFATADLEGYLKHFALR